MYFLIADTVRKSIRFLFLGIIVAIGMATALPASAEPAFAPDFTKLPVGTKVVVMPTDIELYSISAGGILEPKADWTETAAKNFKQALTQKMGGLKIQYSELTESQADDFAEVNDLQGAVARAIDLHHFGPSVFRLPTKDGKLDWSMGDAVADIKKQTGADYALFNWVRDSYASSERVATMILMALVGVGLPGGVQVGYSSLVDLNTGRIVWFNRMLRGVGDLREGP